MVRDSSVVRGAIFKAKIFKPKNYDPERYYCTQIPKYNVGEKLRPCYDTLFLSRAREKGDHNMDTSETQSDKHQI